jgi:D-alanyl-D-alanine carboxypeptidase/D-alanyl-D-alanine-endopeptidase (penicillin-binding protein 4)
MKLFPLFLFFIHLTGYANETTRSFALVDLSSGKVIEKKNQETPMILASVSKLFSIPYALKTLNPNDNFQTSLYINGKIDKVQGVLKGDLYLKGTGDPYLTVQNFISLIYQIKAKGISKVKGSFFLDDSEILFTERISPIGLEDQADNSSMGALNVEFNRFKIWKSLKQASPPLVNIKIKALNKSGAGLKFKHKSKEKGIEQWTINSKEKMRKFESAPTRDSTLFSGHFFRYLAELHGLELSVPTRKNIGNFGKVKLIANNESLSVYELAALGIEYSNNVIAETLLLKAHNKMNKSPKTLKESSTLLMNDLKVTYPKLSWEKLSLANGSGLSLNNKSSALLLVNYLRELSEVFYSNRSFWSFLSINGHSGALSKRINSPSLNFRVYGKSGSVYFVNNLAGYIITNSGKRFAFAIFTSDKKSRNLLNGFNNSKVNEIRKKSKEWWKRETRFMDNLITKWIRKY